MERNKENITKEEKEQASISIIKELYKQNIPIKDIEYLSEKNREEINNIINNLKNNGKEN